jgi:hypothetical protein
MRRTGRTTSFDATALITQLLDCLQVASDFLSLKYIVDSAWRQGQGRKDGSTK